MTFLESIRLFIIHNWVALVSLGISIVAIYIAAKQARIQAMLAKDDMDEKLKERQSQHYEELAKFFFSQVVTRFGTGTLDENGVFDGVDTYIKDLTQISEEGDLKPHWTNGLKHLKRDDIESYNLLNSLREKMEDLSTETKALNGLIENKVKTVIQDTGLSTDVYPIPPGKVHAPNFLRLIKENLEYYLRKCSVEEVNYMKCLKNAKPLDPLELREDGEVALFGTAVAKISQALSAKDVDSLFDQIEKDEELLGKIVEIRKKRIELKDDLRKITDSCELIIRKMGTRTYNTHAECCPK
ncbi:MAG: hypothetical protein QXV17_08945 [Candidatus Micrarchaeaceae archaeon]